MRLNANLFNKLILAVTISGVLYVIWFSFRMQSDQYIDFENEWIGKSSWENDFVRLVGSNDSTRLKNFTKPAIIYFWSGWSDLSIKGLKELTKIAGKDFTIVAPIVKDTDQAMTRIDSTTMVSANFSHGTYWYLHKKVPAIPTYLYIDSLGVIQAIRVGYEDSTQIKDRFIQLGLNGEISSN